MSTVFAFQAASPHSRIGHPEHPDRFIHLQDVLASVRASKVDARAATRDEILRVHESRMVSSLEDACRQGQLVIDPAPTYVAQHSMECALWAAGAAITCMQHVFRGEARNAFALVRPPGHHAQPDRAMGFCLLNNVAIAAAAALHDGAQRVAIIDFDAHHGNGTQAAFLGDERVAYLSMHQWGIYPGTGWYEEAAEARGRIVNIPLPARAGDNTYGQVTADVIEPFVRGFQPELMLVSAGFDAHWNDPLTALGLSSLGFQALSGRLVQLANEYCHGRIVFALEGGYDALNLARGARAVFAALTDGAFEDPGDTSPYKDPDPGQLIEAIRALHNFGS